MLENIHSISDLQKLDVKQLPRLCEEIRQKLISEVTRSGGHLASNLGVVELSVALCYVFGEEDRIVWDVGHQSYVHKILTSRGENFSTLRQKDGISGFPDCEESSADAFNTGHAGTAISVALGLAHARDIAGQSHNVIAVVGDGAMTCGMTYEALNNVKDTKMLVILNDNNMSIGKNVGSATLNMSKLRVGKYDKNKQKLKRLLQKIPLIGKPTYRFLRWCKRRAKLGYAHNSYFDNFNLKYVGAIDGNEIKDLVFYLRRIRDNVTKPTVLHILTKKGKGYDLAEKDPVKYHAVPPSLSGDTVSAVPQDVVESSTVVEQTLCDVAQCDDKVVAISAAMTGAVGLDAFAEKFPDRFFDVGIAEEHAVTFAGGLAKGGAKPFVCIYSTFLQRSYDQILHDVALQNLPVTFLLDRAGFVGEDGKTHQGLFDLSYLSNIPNLTIWTPSTTLQLRQMIMKSLQVKGPVVIRYPRYLLQEQYSFEGKWLSLKGESSCKVKIFAVGPRLCEVAMGLDIEGIQVVCVTSVKPLDCDFLGAVVDCDVVVTLEENVLSGGFGDAVGNYLNAKGVKCSLRKLGVADTFVAHATVGQQLQEAGLDAESLKSFVQKLL